MTPTEYEAYNHMIVMSKLKHTSKWSPYYLIKKRRLTKEGFLSSNPKVLALLKGGSEAFMLQTALRILEDHSHKVHFNNCPKCQKLARTPKARVCPHCHHTWFNAKAS